MERGLVLVHPMDDAAVIEGHGTIGIEILGQLPDVDLVVVPVSGGSLISGVAIALKELRPQTKAVGVQPVGANAMYQSVRANRFVELSEVSTIADGLTAKRPGQATYEIVRRYVDDMVLVTDEEMLHAVAFCACRARIVVEPSGAASIAAVLTGELAGAQGKCVCLVSGGNIEMRLLHQAVLEYADHR